MKTLRRLLILLVAWGIAWYILATHLPAESLDGQNAAKYELAMYAEEWGLTWYADQYKVGDPWTVILIKYDKTGHRTAWVEWDFHNLTDAVVNAEEDFETHHEGFTRDNQGK